MKKAFALPELSLIAFIGPSGSGKSTFARKHFRPTEVIASDYCRGLVADDETDQSVTKEAFEILHFIAAKRLAAGRLTVIDATNVQPDARKPLVALAREYHCLPVAIVFNLPEAVCRERNQSRTDRDLGAHVIRQQRSQLRRSIRGLKREGFRHVFIFDSAEEVDAATVERQPLWNDLRHEHGPFDIIGDVHGCYEELCELLLQLGYKIDTASEPPQRPSGGSSATVESATGLVVQASRLHSAGETPAPQAGVSEHTTPGARPPCSFHSLRHPHGRKAVFLGDLVDRGPGIPDVLRLVMNMVAAGTAFCVPGNHDMKLVRKLRGKNVRVAHGLAETLAQLETEPTEFKQQVVEFLDDLPSHYVLDGGKLVVAHAGMKAEMQGRGSGKVREFALYGETTGETDEFGLPVRYNWAADYRGRAMVVYGHTPVPEPQWVNRTINIDTGCVFGGRLTALRYPERELVSVSARRTYFEPKKPFLPAGESMPAADAPQARDDVLDLADVLGKRIIATRLHHPVTIREENAIAALEAMSRFAVDPRWLIYLPPTMSPCETSTEPDLLEHPAEAFAYYRRQDVPRVICQEKHMGSRAVVIVCRDEAAAVRRFGVGEAQIGIVYTRMGRRFFDDAATERGLLNALREAAIRAGLWDELATDWLCLDCELMPWSAKARELLREQYAAVGAAAQAAIEATVGILEASNGQDALISTLLARHRAKQTMSARFAEAYRRYCWPVDGLDGLRLAPFHVMASEGAVHSDKDHPWHMQVVGRLCAQGAPLLHATEHRVVDVTDPAGESEGVQWWRELTERGGEGMVVKPLSFIARSRRGLVQPAVKCRGREYLRIIYGPEYTDPPNLERLRARGLAAKRSLALREFALGIEALHRFVEREPLRRVHECVFGVLALESEPVDPRL